MIANRQSFLQHIRNGLGRQTSSHSFRELFMRESQQDRDRSTTPPSPEQYTMMVDEFAENCRQLNSGLHRVNSFREAGGVVVELIRSKEVEFGYNKHVMQHDHPDVAALKLWKRFNREAVTLHTAFAGDPHLREKTIESFIGITAAELGIAESGSLLQLTGPGRPRSTSLVPSIHIGLLPLSRMVKGLTEAYDSLDELNSLPDSFVFISGPSKTADIEAHLVHGAHGPCELHVVIICDIQGVEL